MWSRPYMFEIDTNRARPTAASQAANTNRAIGMILARGKCMFKAIRVLIINNESIIPSRHSNDDIRCERYTNMPRSEMINARVIFI